MWQDLECGLYDYSKELTKVHGKNDKESSKKFRIDFLELRDSLFSYIPHFRSHKIWQFKESFYRAHV